MKFFYPHQHTVRDAGPQIHAPHVLHSAREGDAATRRLAVASSEMRDFGSEQTLESRSCDREKTRWLTSRMSVALVVFHAQS